MVVSDARAPLICRLTDTRIPGRLSVQSPEGTDTRWTAHRLTFRQTRKPSHFAKTSLPDLYSYDSAKDVTFNLLGIQEFGEGPEYFLRAQILKLNSRTFSFLITNAVH